MSFRGLDLGAYTWRGLSSEFYSIQYSFYEVVCSNTNQNGLILLNDKHTYISKLLYGIHVYLILFNLFPVSDSLFNFSRIDILWPASLNMVNTTTLCFKPFCIDLKQREGAGVRGMALIKF